jgi:hypothetical protein
LKRASVYHRQPPAQCRLREGAKRGTSTKNT